MRSFNSLQPDTHGALPHARGVVQNRAGVCCSYLDYLQHKHAILLDTPNSVQEEIVVALPSGDATNLQLPKPSAVRHEACTALG